MRTVAIIQARMGSSRLPGKVAEVVAGKPLLAHMIERVKRCDTLDDVVVAIPTVDYVFLHDIVRTAGARVFSWVDEEDVLTRVLMAAHGWQADLIVELTADCPLIDPEIVDHAVRRYLYVSKVVLLDMVSTTRDSLRDPAAPYFPRGMDVRVFPLGVLEDLDKLATDPADREHVSIYAWEHRNRFHVWNLPAPEELRDDVRLTVDTPEDLTLVRTIFEEFLPHRPDFGLRDILELLEYRPELRKINARVQQKAAR